jgi:hypothetical protein
VLVECHDAVAGILDDLRIGLSLPRSLAGPRRSRANDSSALSTRSSNWFIRRSR